MEIDVPKGRYVLAASGGVDSMVLLDLLAKKPGIELVVAHFNHGTRPNAPADENLVRRAASALGLTYEAGQGRLGPGASEEAARTARYEFLDELRHRYRAKSVITAHHQDDMIETAFINLLRGTGRRGLAAISSNARVVRPLLGYTKQEIIHYATEHKLIWHEDESNSDDIYLRNYLRNHVTSKISQTRRDLLIVNIDKVAKIDKLFNSEIAKLSHCIYKEDTINRSDFTQLPSGLADELVVYWLREKGVRDYDKKTVNRINAALRTSKADSTCLVNGKIKLEISKRTARFSHSL